MEYIEDEFDKTKYFLDENRNKIYALKGNGHKNLAYKIMRDIGIEFIYFNRYERKVTPALFLIYGGYVLVDEAEEKYDQPFWDEPIVVTKYTTVGYCSAAINSDYVKYIEDEYGREGNIIDDCYKIDDINGKEIIDEIMQIFKEFRDKQKIVREDEER